MGIGCPDEKLVHSNSIGNEVEEEEEEEEEEEALSLCDLPTKEESQSRKEAAHTTEAQEDFYFGSWGGSLLTESKMCVADEVFFQGQILPFRYSVSSESCLAGLRSDSRNISRSQSMDHCYSVGFTSVSSRSSSVKSYNSSSSGSSTSTTTYKPRVQNQFHSHPSPTPQIRFSSTRQGNVSHRSGKSTLWSFLRVGLVRTPEIELQELKIRSNNNCTNKSFGSRNSNSSSGSSISFSNSKNGRTNEGDVNKTHSKIEKKRKQRFFDIKNGAFFGGCKCSVNVVETVPTRIIIVKSTVNEDEAYAKEEEEQATKKTKHRRGGKQAISRHRTFEWLKQLSLEDAPNEA